MAKKFLFDDESKPVDRVPGLSYLDGFRFGFGFFIALLLGFVLLSLAGALAAHLLRFHY